MPARLILASRSPQRRAILAQLGVEFEVRVPDVHELSAGPPHEVARENARRKAAAIAPEAPGALVLGADTVVSLGSQLYGKPTDATQARATLEALSGRRHSVISAISLMGAGATRVASVRTLVELRALGGAWLDWYVDSGEWRDRAGAYAIQGRGAALVTAIDGDYLNVVGLPVAALLELAPALLWRSAARGDGFAV